MGKIIDAGAVVEVKFPYIKLEGGYNDIFQGYWKIDGSLNNSIDLDIWKPGTYGIGCFEATEGNWGNITAVTKEIYDAKVTCDQILWNRLLTPEWKKHLDNPEYRYVSGEGYKHFYTNRQLSIIGISEDEYKQGTKLFDIKKDLGDAIFKSEDNDDLMHKVTDVYNKYFSEN